MSDVINVSCPCNHKGKHYKGFVIHPGVSIVLQPAPCLAGKTQILFQDGNGNNLPDQPTGIYLEGVSGADIFDRPVAEYLDIRV